jgi:hypothetical protein
LKTDDKIGLAFNFAEADVIDNKEIRLFRDHVERRFLVGFSRRENWNWIEKNRIYNIRPESAKLE